MNAGLKHYTAGMKIFNIPLPFYLTLRFYVTNLDPCFLEELGKFKRTPLWM